MIQTYQDFLDQIAEKESSFLTRPDPQNSYTTVNSLGYLGNTNDILFNIDTANDNYGKLVLVA